MEFLPPSTRPGEAHQYAASIQRHLRVALSAIALSQSKPVSIQEAKIDVFSSYGTVDSLGLRQELAEGLGGISNIHLRGQYRFWEGALSLGIFTSLKKLTLSDCTIHYDTLGVFLRSQEHPLEYINLDAVGLLPYAHLGYLTWSGDLPAAITWLLSIQSHAALYNPARRLSPHVDDIRLPALVAKYPLVA